MKTFGQKIKNWLIILLCFSGTSMAVAQNASLSNPVLNQQSFANFGSGEIDFLYGSPAGRGNLPVEDNPFFKNGWLNGLVIFRNGKSYKGEIRFNLVKNELQFKNGDRPNVFADPVSAFTITDPNEGKPITYYFQSGYPDAGMQSGNTFYLLLDIGKNVHLLKYLSKKTVEIYQYNTSPKLEFKNSEDLWLYDPAKNKIKYLNAKPASLKKAFKTYASMIDHYVAEKNITNLSEDDLVTLCRKINKVTGM